MSIDISYEMQELSRIVSTSCPERKSLILFFFFRNNYKQQFYPNYKRQIFLTFEKLYTESIHFKKRQFYILYMIVLTSF